MAIVQRSKFCKNCGKYTLHQFNTFSNGMGCLLTILTCGIFLIFLIPYKIFVEPFRNIYRCQSCGKGRLFLFAAVVFAASAVHADTFKMKNGKTVDVSFRRLHKGLITVSDGGGGLMAVTPGFNPSAISGGTPPIKFSDVQSIEFDGDRDWLSVTMKNGDFVRGKAQSLKGGFLRLEKVEKPIRVSNVTEILATEAPKEPSGE